MAHKESPAGSGDKPRPASSVQPPPDLVGLKEISPSNVSTGDNPKRLLSAAADLSWVGGRTMIPGLLSSLIVAGAKEDKLKAVDILAGAERAGLDTYTLAHTVGWAMKFNCPPDVDAGLRRILVERNKRFGLADEKVIDQWKLTDDTENRDRTIFINMNVLEALHKKRPLAPAALHETYGISCFGRYNAETLARQYDSMGDKPDTLGLAIFCRTDWGGLFYDMSDPMERLSRELSVKIVEGEQPGELMSYLGNVRGRHGEKAKFAVVVMHKDTLDALLDRTLPDWQKGLGSFFDERPTFAIVSSKVSEPGQAKDRLEAKGAKVIGPPHIIYQCPKKFEFARKPDGSVEFDVEFSKAYKD
jgi:hypothetical protein